MKKYDIIIIGGGVGGLVTASGAAQLGAKVALIEKEALGGDCLHYGCVPTKRLVHSAGLAHKIRNASEFGIKTGPVSVDFKAVMAGVRRSQAELGKNDDPERFERMGIRVIFGSGSFVDPETFELNGERISGRRFLIATGSHPVIKDIAGLDRDDILTSRTILGLTELPSSLLVIGAGPIAMEYAQVFSRLGSEVTILLRKERLLSKEDVEMSAALEEAFVDEGIRIIKRGSIKGATIKGKLKTLEIDSSEGSISLTVEKILMAIGQGPNTHGLNLEAAGVEHEKSGIGVDNTMLTNVGHIYACGDVTGGYKFTHVAEYQAGIIITNAFFPIIKRHTDYTALPWVTYVDPELARCGLTESEAALLHGDIKVFRFRFENVDRAVIAGQGRGLIKLIINKKKLIVGAHIFGPHAGEIIHEYALAMQTNIPLTAISKTIHAYPTVAQAVKRAADEYYREKFFSGWFPKIAKRLTHRVE